MENINITISDIVVKDGVRYRIIGYAQGVFSLCCMDSSKLVIELIDSVKLIHMIEEKTIGHIKNPNTDRNVIDISLLNAVQAEAYLNKLNFVMAVAEAYGPLYNKLIGKNIKTEFKEAFETAGLKKTMAWRIIKNYLQSGLDPVTLADQRIFRSRNKSYEYKYKTGRPSASSIGVGCVLTEEVLETMEEAKKRYLSGRDKTIKSAYREMIRNHYMRLVESPSGMHLEILPQNMRPTERQFYHYVKTRCSEKEIAIAKTSAQEYRNSQRLLLSDNLNGVSGPGSLFEVDECELDVSVVSEMDPEVAVGRPIVYAMIDVYSRMIVAVSIAFDNNSFKGITNCLLNLLEDKQTWMKKYNIQIEKNEMPSHIIPQRIRSDYGSEYISYNMERIGKELGIQMELAAPGTGSLKGQIEQLFHQIHAAQNPVLESHGLIEKRHDSNHHREASLTISEVTAMVLATVAVHNRRYMENYPLTAKMRKAHVNPTPVDLWNYGVEVCGSPRVISNEDEFRYSLLLPVSAKLSKSGIKYKTLQYMNFKDAELLKEMQDLKNRSKAFNCRMDPRNVGSIYYLRDNSLMVAPLNVGKTGMRELEGLSLEDYDKLLKAKRELDRAGKEENLKLEIALQDRQKAIVNQAVKRKTGPADTNNLKVNRGIEKQREALNHSVVPAENSTAEPCVLQTDNSTETEKTKSEHTDIISDVYEALDAFEEDEWGDLI
ncbi:MAG: transposase family protein [Bulleidia sp.]|nr:transposase family protein [Bulleidia sp.]